MKSALAVAAVLIGLLCATPSWAAFAHVQSVDATPCPASDTCTLTISAAGIGDLLIATGGWFSTGTTSITQIAVTSACTTGNWTMAGAEIVADDWVWIAYAVATGSGSCLVTANGNGGGDFHAFGAAQFTGQHATPVSVAFSSSTGTGTSWSDGLTVAAIGDLIIGVSGHASASQVAITPDVNYTQIGEEEDGDNQAVYNGVYRIATASGAHTVSWTGPNVAWGAATMSFQPLVGGGATDETFGFKRRRVK